MIALAVTMMAAVAPQSRSVIQPALALRGGSLDSFEGKFLAVSCGYITLSGLTCIAAPEKAKELIIEGEKFSADNTVMSLLGTAYLAWGIAKLTAIRTSTEKEFAQGNMIPMLALVAATASKTTNLVVLLPQLAFLAGYTFFGFLKKRTSDHAPVS
jgi:hypothetical protein